MLYKRLLFVPILVLAGIFSCLIFVGCGGGGGANQAAVNLDEDFQTLSSAKWTVNAAVSTIDGKLALKSSPGLAAEVQSQSSFLNKSVQFTAASQSWAADTSFGFETAAGELRQAIIVTQGSLGIINKTLPGANEKFVAIPGWNALKDEENVFLLKWTANAVQLYINGELSVEYIGALIPTAQMKVHLIVDDTVNDLLVVDQVKISENDGVDITNDDLAELDSATWTVLKGSLVTTDNGWLVLRSATAQAAEVQSKAAFLNKELEIKAGQSDWKNGTSIGYELTDASGSYKMIINNGQLQIANPGGEESKPIIAWDTLSNQENVYKLRWRQGFVQLLISNMLKETYSGVLLPSQSAKLRFNASGTSTDELRIDYVKVSNLL